MRIFDALIDHPGRSPAHMLFDQDTLLLMLTGHDDAFGQGRTGAADVTTGALPPGSLWRTKLAELSESRIGELFDGVLDRRRQLALRARIKALEDALP